MFHDPSGLLSGHERDAFYALLPRYGHTEDTFAISIEEDQSSMDMNDLDYVVILMVKVIHQETQKKTIYSSPQDSGLWLKNFEEDLREHCF